MGTEYQIRKMTNSGDGWWWELHSYGIVLGAAKLQLNMIKRVYFILCDFYHNKKIIKNSLHHKECFWKKWWFKTWFSLLLKRRFKVWPPDAKSWLTGKDPAAGNDWRQEEKGMTEDETVGRHHQFNEHEFEQALWDSKAREAWRAAVHGVAKS